MPNSDSTSSADTLSKILSYLVAATTILGIPVGLYGYLSSQHANRVDRAFQFYEDFRGATLQDDFNLLIENWNAKADQAQQLLVQNNSGGFTQLVGSLLQTDQEQAALNEIIQFFDGIYSCVGNSLCDNNATIALLQEPANQIYSAYGSYLANAQQKNPNYAVGIVKIRALPKTWSLP
ncbi:MAG TPA: hypothetical protein VMR17_16720 [Xanthobacteraceae bacterium]|jgi:hypothetical protein|nr:hypothetical protein [Xanthobacteraceae bacterium]